MRSLPIFSSYQGRFHSHRLKLLIGVFSMRHYYDIVTDQPRFSLSTSYDRSTNSRQNYFLNCGVFCWSSTLISLAASQHLLRLACRLWIVCILVLCVHVHETFTGKYSPRKVTYLHIIWRVLQCVAYTHTHNVL